MFGGMVTWIFSATGQSAHDANSEADGYLTCSTGLSSRPIFAIAALGHPVKAPNSAYQAQDNIAEEITEGKMTSPMGKLLMLLFVVVKQMGKKIQKTLKRMKSKYSLPNKPTPLVVQADSALEVKKAKRTLVMDRLLN